MWPECNVNWISDSPRLLRTATSTSVVTCGGTAIPEMLFLACRFIATNSAGWVVALLQPCRLQHAALCQKCLVRFCVHSPRGVHVLAYCAIFHNVFQSIWAWGYHTCRSKHVAELTAQTFCIVIATGASCPQYRHTSDCDTQFSTSSCATPAHWSRVACRLEPNDTSLAGVLHETKELIILYGDCVRPYVT